ncbi:MAG: XdhC family protein [Scytolyngbya sp. HA4215-MV1]|jgi:xanthine dehydrogenase accessory factor|nr:XdhC family protein [Scytolyngbya sp. HA4215-MV1]
MLNFYQQLAEALQHGAIVLATIAQVKGSVPREVGAQMAICPDGKIIGTIGGGAGEAKVIQAAQQVLQTGQKQLIEIDLTGAPQRATEGVCGGMMQVWLERWQGDEARTRVTRIQTMLESGQSGMLITPLDSTRLPDLELGHSPLISAKPIASLIHSSSFSTPILAPPTLLIVGAGHCAVPLAQIAHLAGFRVVVQDDRPEFATTARFPQAVQVLAQPIAAAVSALTHISQLYAALVTRGYLHDVAALQVLRQRPLHYIGMIGSEKRVKTVLQALQQSERAASLNPTTNLPTLPRIHAPIGLDIGALTPEEIAVSICAELIKVRRGGTGQSMSSCDRVKLRD